MFFYATSLAQQELIYSHKIKNKMVDSQGMLGIVVSESLDGNVKGSKENYILSYEILPFVSLFMSRVSTLIAYFSVTQFKKKGPHNNPSRV